MKLTMVLLAAGASRRFGRENKLLYPIEGKPMYRHTLDRLTALCSAERQLLVMTNTPEITVYCRERGIPSAASPQADEGIAATIRTAAGQAEPGTLVFFTADQPWLKADTIRTFLDHAEKGICGLGCMRSGEHWGNPAWFSREYLEELLALRGDRGGKQILKRHPEDLWYQDAADRELEDVDIPPCE